MHSMVQRMLEPDSHQEQANGGSSEHPRYSGGLLDDNVTMLLMLREGKLLGAGPLLLALQAYLKPAGVVLPVPYKLGAPLQPQQLHAALSPLKRLQQLELRSFLLQVWCARRGP
jgi:hypothetical protein